MTEAIRRLGRYELLEQLGEGGMGAVWLARLTGAHGFEKLCIVKTVLPAIAKDKDFVSRFLHEGRVLTQLSHANIAQVFDMGEEDGSLYLALEYVPGVDLARLHEALRARGEVLPLPVAVFIVQQAAEGLGYAHRRAAHDGGALNVVHRDVSPQNVMVSYDGEVKVIDFGIAKSEARSKATAQASVMGKLGYMAPEQALGAEVDHRADQYAAAVVLWELLANRSFIPRGTMTEMVVAMAHPQLRPLAPLRPEVPLSLEQVVLRALAPAANQRFPTTDDFSKALHDELVRAGQLPTKKAVGEYVRQHCTDAYVLQQQLLSRLSTVRTKMPVPAAAVETAKATPGFEQTYVRPTGDFGPPAAGQTSPASPAAQARTALAQGSANPTQPQAGNQLTTQPNLRPVSLEEAGGASAVPGNGPGTPGHTQPQYAAPPTTQQQFTGLPPLHTQEQYPTATQPGGLPPAAMGGPAGAGSGSAPVGPAAVPARAGTTPAAPGTAPPGPGVSPPGAWGAGGTPPGQQPTTGDRGKAVAPNRTPLFVVLGLLALGALVVGGLGVKALLEKRGTGEGVAAAADAGTTLAAAPKDGVQPGAGTADAPKDGTQPGAGTTDAPKDGTQPGADAGALAVGPVADVPDAGGPAAVAVAGEADAGIEVPPPPVADGPLVDVARAVELYEERDKAFVRAGKADGLKKGQALEVVGAAAEPGRHPQVGKATVLEVKADTARVELDRKARRFEGERFVALAAKPEPKPDDGVKPPPAKGPLKARLKLTRTPVWAVTLFNTSGFGWSNCTITIPGQKRYALKSLPAGFSREMPIQYFADDPSAPVLADSVQIKCAQGAVTLPATE